MGHPRRIERERQFHDEIFSTDARESVRSFYIVARRSRERYQRAIQIHGAGKSVLELGCGPRSHTAHLAQHGAEVTAIDISPVALDAAARHSKALGHRVRFVQMSAEQLSFRDDSFDIICGMGILHHLRLEAAYAEIARALKPDGHAVFMEPLGHNPLINYYRRKTPHLRSADEHPLLIEDLRLAQRYFDRVESRFDCLVSLAAYPLMKVTGSRRILEVFDALDRCLLAMIPPARRYAWITRLSLAGPKAVDRRVRR